ncbi:MAG: inositol monophosphatase family protein [Kiloniellales bacterium]
MLPDIDKVTRLVESVAAEEVLPRFRTLADADIRRKHGGEVVTVADEAAEARLTAALIDLLPGSVVVGEEAAAADPAVIGRLSGLEPVWVIDPVDGTSNFSQGIGVFAVMLAFVREGRIRAAWIHEPLAGRTAVAETGEGAWMGGQRLQVATPKAPAEMRGTLYAGSFGDPALIELVRTRRGRVLARKSRRCAGAEYMSLATGEMDFALFTKLAPWDHAPGVLIQWEAGGIASMLNGRPFDPVKPVEGLLLAPDEPSWRALHETLLGA